MQCLRQPLPQRRIRASGVRDGVFVPSCAPSIQSHQSFSLGSLDYCARSLEIEIVRGPGRDRARRVWFDRRLKEMKHAGHAYDLTFKPGIGLPGKRARGDEIHRVATNQHKWSYLAAKRERTPKSDFLSNPVAQIRVRILRTLE